MSEIDPGMGEDLGGPRTPLSAGTKRRRWQSLGLRGAAVGLIVCGLAAGSYGIASAASSHGAPTGSASLAAAPAAKPSSSPKKATPLTPLGSPRPVWPGGPGLFGPSGFGAVGTITGLGDTTITIENEFGVTSTVTTNSSTIYEEGGRR